MANYYASCRTNYFKVKDEEAFLAAMERVPDIEIDVDAKGVCILGNNPDGAGWPQWTYGEDGGEDIDLEFDLVVAVSEHLQDGEVAIFMESGAEKLRYIVGYAEAINSDGERADVSLNNIYALAADLTDRPEDITTAEY